MVFREAKNNLDASPFNLYYRLYRIYTDVAVKLVDCSPSSLGMEDLQDKEGDRKWHRFGAGLGGSDAFVSTGLQGKLESLSLY